MQGGISDSEGPWTAAEAASLTARLASAAAHAADLAERVAHVGTVVAHEFSLVSVCAAVLDETIRTLGAQFVALHLVDEETGTLNLVGERRIPRDLVANFSQIPVDTLAPTARAASSRQVQIVTGVHKVDPRARITLELLRRTSCNTMVALPLLAHDRLVAVLSFALQEEHTFTAGERATLDSCAHIFSFAVAHAMLFEVERQLRELFEAVGRAAVAVTSELETEASLQDIVDEARRIANAQYAALGVGVAEDRAFEPWLFSGMTQEQAQRIGRHPRPVGTLGAVVALDRAIRVADVRRHPAFRGIPPHHPEIGSFLAVPIHFEGRCVGNLFLANKQSNDRFSAEDERAIELLAAHAGAVIHQGQLRRQLDAERARFKAIVESAPHGVVFADSATGTIIANARASELVGDIFLPGGEHRGELLTPDGSPLPREGWPFLRATRGETVKPQEFLFRHPDGREIPVLISAAPIREHGPQGTVVLFEDISAIKQLQRLREEWASVITHELRHPLTVLTTSLGLLREMAPHITDELFPRVIDRADRAAAALKRLIEDLADASLIESRRLQLRRQRVVLEALAQTLVSEHQARSPDRVIALTVRGDVPPVDADPIRLEQVLSNLLTNAVKYSPPASRVDVEVNVEAGEVRMLVTNRGPGLAAEDLPRIFDRFYRTAEARAGGKGGLGLGLYVAKGIIEAHGGRIWAESRPGESTTFHVALPARRDA